MKAFTMRFADRLKRFDICLAACAFFLTAVSLLMLFGIRDAPMTSGIRLLKMQAAASAVGFVLMILMTVLDYEEVVNRLWIPLLVFQLLILGVTLIYGTAEGANKSWLFIGGFGIQPSEFVKISFIITFSKHLDLVKGRINRFVPLMGLLFHAGGVIGLILLSGDLGVALVYVGIFLVMLYSAGLHIFYFIGAAVASCIAIPYLWPHLREDQQKRIIYGFNPEGDPLGKGMQPLLGRKAISEGGFFGKGLNGGGVYKTLYACENDFAFSSVCEKFGIVTGLLVIAALVAIVARCLIIAKTSRKDTGSLICIGVAACIIIQSVENIGMCLARLPVIGITLPFISYGGSSCLSTYLMLGMVHSVKAHRVKYFFERDKR
ncbi:MAG: FtsW/RodA/SpoVE family cell cycle protein [Clostridia bacterium]|nr:FtsW/RodA/SpoVE family cell cycle protein [Clostridia bacterium]MBP5174144.1 FtsW/RodA/SpoVE family cell cycle protein [Clostridia bacterium]